MVLELYRCLGNLPRPWLRLSAVVPGPRWACEDFDACYTRCVDLRGHLTRPFSAAGELASALAYVSRKTPVLSLRSLWSGVQLDSRSIAPGERRSAAMQHWL